MKRKQLGNTALEVADIALGTVEIALDYGIPSDEGHRKPSTSEAIRFLQEAIDAGVNLIDTAQAYGNSEALIGEALGTRRHEVVLVTKLTPIAASELENEGALQAKVRTSIQESLQRLRTDHVDVLMLHSATLELIEKGGMLLHMLRDLQAEGLTHYTGASVYEEAGPAAVGCGAFDVIQIGYNVLDRSPEVAVLPMARQRGVGMVARSVLLKGVLTPRYALLPKELQSLQEAAIRLEALASQAGISLVELAYRYVLSENVLALCGTARMEELNSVIEYAKRGPLDGELLSQIRQIQVSEGQLLNPANWPF